MTDDEALIRRTYELAREATENGNYPFGALLAVDGEIVRTSQNSVETDRDPTAHPELKLARWAGRELSVAERQKATLYASTEPCPMCAGALYWSGVSRIVYGVRGDAAGNTDLIPTLSCETVFESGTLDIDVVGPVLESEGLEVQREFWEGSRPDATFVRDLLDA